MDLRSPVVLALGAALLIGALVLLRPRTDDTSSSEPPPDERRPGEHTAERKREIEEGEAAGLDAQARGELTGELAPLDYDRRERGRFEVVHGSPVGGHRRDARVHIVSSVAQTDRAVRSYFWQTLEFSGAGFFYPGPTGTGALVIIEQPEGTFHACQLMPTEWLTRQSWVQAYWVDPELIRGVYLGAGTLTGIQPNSVSRMHRPTDQLVRMEDNLRTGARLQGRRGAVTQVFEHFPTWWIHHREHLIRPTEIWARSIAVPESEAGHWSLVCAMEQGDNLGGSVVLSQWVTPVPWLWHVGHNPWVDGNPEASERAILRIPDSLGKRRLARLHPKTGEPWRCFSFARWYAVPENPAWSFVWWSPWYPQHRDDPEKRLKTLPETFEPHLGGGSQLSAAFAKWILPRSLGGFAGTGDPPRGQWVGAIPVGLPQDCIRIGDLVRCEVGRPPDDESPCGYVGGADDLWRIGYGAPGGGWCEPPASTAPGQREAGGISAILGGAVTDSAGRWAFLGGREA